MLLWDCDDRTYSYYIEISQDQKNWTRVVDKTQDPCRYTHILKLCYYTKAMAIITVR